VDINSINNKYVQDDILALKLACMGKYYLSWILIKFSEPKHE